MRFYMCENNDITAVVTRPVYERIRDHIGSRNQAERDDKPFDEPYPTPIFTFGDIEELQTVLTGTLDDMRQLLAGHDVLERGFYVPFSNCGGHLSALLHEVLTKDLSEIRFITTLRQAMEAFNLAPTGNPVPA